MLSALELFNLLQTNFGNILRTVIRAKINEFLLIYTEQKWIQKVGLLTNRIRAKLREIENRKIV